MFNLLLHELGHAMGLQHPHEGVLLDPALDNHDQTVMSYNRSWTLGPGDPAGFRSDLAPFDVQALNFLYGSESGFHPGTSWVWSDVLHRLTVVGSALADVLLALPQASDLRGMQGHDSLAGYLGDDSLQGGAGRDSLDGGLRDDVLNGGLGNDVLSGGEGVDTAVFSGAAAVRVRLWQTTGQVTGQGRDTLSSIENLISGGGADDLQGDGLANQLSAGAGDDTVSGMSGNDTLFGGDGDDLLAGGAGSDRLTGGLGADRLDGGADALRDVFVFADPAECGMGAAADVVTGFTSGIDGIDLRGMDANSMAALDQAFAFGGMQAVARGIWFADAGANLVVRGDVTGDLIADFEIRLVGVASLVAADFLL